MIRSQRELLKWNWLHNAWVFRWAERGRHTCRPASPWLATRDWDMERRRRERSLAWGVSPRLSVGKEIIQPRSGDRCRWTRFYLSPRWGSPNMYGPGPWGSRPRLSICRRSAARAVFYPTTRVGYFTLKKLWGIFPVGAAYAARVGALPCESGNLTPCPGTTRIGQFRKTRRRRYLPSDRRTLVRMKGLSGRRATAASFLLDR